MKKQAKGPKFRVGQVVATRSVDGKWEYDRIGSIRLAGEIYSEDTAWLVMSTGRIALRHLRPLSVREAGPARGRKR